MVTRAIGRKEVDAHGVEIVANQKGAHKRSAEDAGIAHEPGALVELKVVHERGIPDHTVRIFVDQILQANVLHVLGAKAAQDQT